MIYIHVPFCHRKCTYCAFYSKPVGTQRVASAYVDALLEEMRQRCHEQAHPIRTVYFGGGTPSILPLSELERIVKALRECFDLSQVEEVTLEANPEDLTVDYLQGLKTLGLVNRLSIGIQSLDDSMLRLIGRRHTAAQALAAVENAHAVGFHNLSVDFIYGLPDNPAIPEIPEYVTHVSAYALTVEPGTALAVQVEQGRVVLPDEDEVVRQYHALHQRFLEAGFRQYEVSNYARPGFESKHNSRYWDRTPYLGLGPGAHSFDGFRRRWNNPDGSFEEETLTEADAYNELLMTALRTTRGLPLSQVPEKYHERLHREMQPYVDCGWIIKTASGYAPTEEGLLHADGMAAGLFV
ncbi:MAG: radical SAM family heme chaperone HemW [Bacteroidales bacterium]|nr:radical SAM family heme chaperone HemW [Bacteroidales bacterium]